MPRKSRGTSAAIQHLKDSTRNKQQEQADLAIEKAFISWCSRHGLNPHPLTTQNILRYLHSHHLEWSWSYRKSIATALRRLNRQRGCPEVDTDTLSQYLLAVRRTLGSKRNPPTRAISVEQFAALMEALSTPVRKPKAGLPLLRAALILTRLTGHPLIKHYKVPGPESTNTLVRMDFIESGDGQSVTILSKDETLVITRQQARWMYPHLLAGLQAHQQNPHRTKAHVQSAINLLADKFHDIGHPEGAYRDTAFWLNLTDEEFYWHLVALDGFSEMRIRNRVNLLVGTTLARRHQDLCEIGLQHVRFPARGDAIITQPRSKTDQAGQGVTKYVQHADETRTCATGRPCSPYCPYRALRDLVDYEQHVWKRTTGPILGTRYGKTVKPLTSKGWNYTLKAAWQRAGLGDSTAISSRSMRVTGASLLAEMGATIEQVASVTDHIDWRTTSTYIRLTDPLATLTVDTDEAAAS